MAACATLEDWCSVRDRLIPWIRRRHFRRVRRRRFDRISIYIALLIFAR